MDTKRQHVSSGTVWEGIVGYSRAVRVGPFIYVAGTTATDDDGNVVGVGDPGAQTDYIIRKIQRALSDAGGSLSDVVRTRIYLTSVNDWESVGRVHGRHFADIRPANALVEVSALVGSEYLVEIEADAVLGYE
ncbi:MAG TPA: RidA family protein [Thermomicrobiales bacterium]|nr:RidA family protein [Thermomicrobiales bacterium]